MKHQPVLSVCLLSLLCLLLLSWAWRRRKKSGAHRWWKQRAEPPGLRWTIRAAQLTMGRDRGGKNWVSDADRPTKDPGGERRELYLMMACGLELADRPLQ